MSILLVSTRQKPGTRRDIDERRVCMLFVVIGWACIRRCYPLLLSGSICLFLSRKLFENKPSTSDLGEFFKIDPSQPWPCASMLTVGGERSPASRSRAEYLGKRGGGKQSDGKLHNHHPRTIHKIVRQQRDVCSALPPSLTVFVVVNFRLCFLH